MRWSATICMLVECNREMKHMAWCMLMRWSATICWSEISVHANEIVALHLISMTMHMTWCMQLSVGAEMKHMHGAGGVQLSVGAEMKHMAWCMLMRGGVE